MINIFPENIADIVNELFAVKIPEENYTAKLTNPVIGLNAMQLVYLLNRIEEVYEVQLDMSSLLNGEFNSIEGIAGILKEQKNR